MITLIPHPSRARVVQYTVHRERHDALSLLFEGTPHRTPDLDLWPMQLDEAACSYDVHSGYLGIT